MPLGENKTITIIIYTPAEQTDTQTQKKTKTVLCSYSFYLYQRERSAHRYTRQVPPYLQLSSLLVHVAQVAVSLRQHGVLLYGQHGEMGGPVE